MFMVGGVESKGVSGCQEVRGHEGKKKEFFNVTEA